MALLACSPLRSSAMFKIPAAAFFYLLLPFPSSYSCCPKNMSALCQITVLTLVHSQILIQIDLRSFCFSSNEMWNQKKRSDGCLMPRSACFLKCLWLWMEVLPVLIGSVLVGWHLPWLVLLSIQINGVDMTEARHDQAVALLTGTSPTISLVVERDPKASMGSPGQSRARAHSPPPPEPSDSPDQEEEGLQGNHLGQMEDEYPIEVRARH